METEINLSLSVDCVIFGYDAEGLKVLLVEHQSPTLELCSRQMKLPGGMISPSETTPEAARRILLEQTGLDRLSLKQIDVFSDPNRLNSEELKRIQHNHKTSTNRVVTVGYYTLVAITQLRQRTTKRKGAQWHLYNEVKGLAMDHYEILSRAIELLREDFDNSPIAFELLRNKFTIRELQELCSAVNGVHIDGRNFRKKVLSSAILSPTGEREVGVRHKPAEYYSFDSTEYKRLSRRGLRLLGI